MSKVLDSVGLGKTFTALAVTPAGTGHEVDNGVMDKIVLSSDDYPWCNDKFRMLFYKLRDILKPFSSCGDEFADDRDTEFLFKLTLGADTQDAVTHYIKEVMINYLLAQWFLDRMYDNIT